MHHVFTKYNGADPVVCEVGWTLAKPTYIVQYQDDRGVATLQLRRGSPQMPKGWISRRTDSIPYQYMSPDLTTEYGRVLTVFLDFDPSPMEN